MRKEQRPGGKASRRPLEMCRRYRFRPRNVPRFGAYRALSATIRLQRGTTLSLSILRPSTLLLLFFFFIFVPRFCQSIPLSTRRAFATTLIPRCFLAPSPSSRSKHALFGMGSELDTRRHVSRIFTGSPGLTENSIRQ